MIKPALHDSNVNLCFLEKLGEKKRDKNLIALINFRNCGINTVHNAIKNEEVTSVWKVESKCHHSIRYLRTHHAPCLLHEYHRIKL